MVSLSGLLFKMSDKPPVLHCSSRAPGREEIAEARTIWRLAGRMIPFALKIDPQRSLHHARRAGAGRRAESPVGLNAIGVEGHIAVNVSEIRLVEQIVCLPSELERALLSKFETLEQRK